MKNKDVWFVRRFTGFVPAHPNGILLLAFTVGSVLGLTFGADWLTEHHFNPYYAYGCYALTVLILIIFVALFFRHTDFRHADW